VRLATSVETGDARKLDVARLKKLTGEDAITAALKYENLFEFRMSAKLVLATNHRPEIPAADDAIWRRVRQVNFDQPVPEEKRIDDLAQALLETEAPGILAWAVRGFVEYQSFGRLREPEELRKAVREYRENEDVIREYVDERITLKLGAKISKQDVYRDYSDWAKDSNLRPAARKKVAMELERLGFVDSDDRRFWLDAVLRQP